MRYVCREKVIRVTAAYPALPAQGPATAARSRPGDTADHGPGAACAWLGWRLSPSPGAEHCARVFAGAPEQVARARAFVAGALAGCPARETLVTCAAELCANAVEHTASGAGGLFTVEVVRPADGVAFVAVTDGGSPAEPTVRPLGLPAVADREGEYARVDSAVAGASPGAGDRPGRKGRAGEGPGWEDIAEGGRGLALVVALSSRWGYQDVPGAAPGRIVWAQATWPVLVTADAIPGQYRM
jgi:hypothetical protein